MPWPATVGLNQLAFGVIAALTNAASAFAFTVIQPGGTVGVAAAVGQTVLAAFAVGGATTGGAVSVLIPGIHVQSAILTASSLSVITNTDHRGRSLLVYLTPAAP